MFRRLFKTPMEKPIVTTLWIDDGSSSCDSGFRDHHYEELLKTGAKLHGYELLFHCREDEAREIFENATDLDSHTECDVCGEYFQFCEYYLNEDNTLSYKRGGF